MLPEPLPSTEHAIYWKFAEEPSKGIYIMTKPYNNSGPMSSSPITPSRLCLLKLNMPADGTLESLIMAGEPTSLQPDWGFYTIFTHPPAQSLVYNHCSYAKIARLGRMSFALDSEHAHSRLVELGVYCDVFHSDNVEPQEMCQILSITIRPRDPVPLVWNITDVQATETANASGVQKRLTWKWHGMRDSQPFGLPFSKTTGPFSHFIVFCRGRELGRAYCNEFPLQQSDIESCEWEGEDVEVIIEGTFFGGGKASSGPVLIPGSEVMFA